MRGGFPRVASRSACVVQAWQRGHVGHTGHVGRRDVGRVCAAGDEDGDVGGNLSWIVEQQQSLQASAEQEDIEAEMAASGACLLSVCCPSVVID